MSSLRTVFCLLAAAAIAACSSASNTGSPDSGSDASSPKGDAGHDGSTPKHDAENGVDSPTGPGEAGESGGGGDTWTNYAQGFFKTYCVECHNATTPYAMQDFNVYADVKGLDATIRCGVAPAGMTQSGCSPSGPMAGQFPISDKAGTNPKPSSAERLRIVAWINAGAPQ